MGNAVEFGLRHKTNRKLLHISGGCIGYFAVRGRGWRAQSRCDKTNYDPARSADGLDPSNDNGDEKVLLGYLGSKTGRT